MQRNAPAAGALDHRNLHASRRPRIPGGQVPGRQANPGVGRGQVRRDRRLEAVGVRQVVGEGDRTLRRERLGVRVAQPLWSDDGARRNGLQADGAQPLPGEDAQESGRHQGLSDARIGARDEDSPRVCGLVFNHKAQLDYLAKWMCLGF